MDSDLRLAPHPPLPRYYRAPEERQARVNAMFDATAKHYDRVTRLMSFGSGDWYRRQAMQRAGMTAGDTVLDIGSGTGALALAAQRIVGATGRVVAVDPSGGMLGQARAAGVQNTVQGGGEALPLASQQFDWVVMGYALRHVPDLRAAFAEYLRVLKPGGKVLLLEWTKPTRPFAARALRFYLERVVPTLAGAVTGSGQVRELMQYYWDTIEQCVPPPTIVAALTDAGFVAAGSHRVLGMFIEYSGARAARPASSP